MKTINEFRILIIVFALLVVGLAVSMCSEARAQQPTRDTVALVTLQTQMIAIREQLQGVTSGQTDLLKELRAMHEKGLVYRQDAAADRREIDLRILALENRMTAREIWEKIATGAAMLLTTVVGWVLRRYYLIIKEDK